MVRIAIIGHAGDKFTPLTEAIARGVIQRLLKKADHDYGPIPTLISGGCPMGGIDIWAEQEAEKLGFSKLIYKPGVNQWNPPGEYGFKKRNIDIAMNCDILYNIVVRALPDGYGGDVYEDYHCMKHREMDDHPHTKSGGCWTLWEAKKLGKECHFIIIDAEEVIV